jgi:biopolymer transport protein ExbD
MDSEAPNPGPDMKRFSDRHALQTLSELNVTPLLDLAFVLLIIFMITTPLMEKSVDVVLPSTNAARNSIDPGAVQTVVLHRDEQIDLNGVPVALADLQGELERLRATLPEVAVVIRSHRDLAVQRLVDVMDAVQRAKITKVGVVTTPEAP